MTPQELYDALWARKCSHEPPPMEAYAELTRATTFRRWLGWRGTESRWLALTVPAGTTIKVVMVSRLGDLGITTDLDAQYGYDYRTTPDEGLLTHCRFTREKVE